MPDELSQRRRLNALEERVAALEGERLNIIEAERLQLEPDDVLLVHVAADTTQPEMDEVARVVAEHLGTRRVLILAGDTKVTVGKLPPDEPGLRLAPEAPSDG